MVLIQQGLLSCCGRGLLRTVLKKRAQEELQLLAAAHQCILWSSGVDEGKLAPDSLLDVCKPKEVYVNLRAPVCSTGTQDTYYPIIVIVKVPFLKKVITVIFWLLHTSGESFLVTSCKLLGISGLTNVKYW